MEESVLTWSRYHRRRSCRATGYGLRPSCSSASSVRSVLVFHGCSRLLVLRYVKGYYHRRKFFLFHPHQLPETIWYVRM